MVDPLDFLLLFDPTGMAGMALTTPDIIPDPTFSTGDPPELQRIYEAATETLAEDPDNVQAYFRRGVVAQSKRWYAQAFHDFREVLKREPKHPKACMLMSEVLASLGHYDAAKQAREEALAIDAAAEK
jgi:tetratricopeptide (TPR) repeat protein